MLQASPESSAPVIHFDQVSKRYAGGHEALSQLSFELAAGEMAFVTGHSGAGKSTLLKLLGLIERPSRRMVMVGGGNLGSVRRRGIPRLRRQVGMVFQDHRLLMERTVFANVELPLVIGGVACGRARPARACGAGEGRPAGVRAKSPPALSAGEQQRVGIARAIVGKPPLLIADEPTGNLDPQLAVEIMGLFAEFQQVGTTVLVASHDLPLIKRMKKRVIVLDHGRLVDDLAARRSCEPPSRASRRSGAGSDAACARAHRRLARTACLESAASLRRLAARPLGSVLTMAVMGLALALPLAFYLLLGNVQRFGDALGQSQAISVFLKPGLGAAAVAAGLGAARPPGGCRRRLEYAAAGYGRVVDDAGLLRGWRRWTTIRCPTCCW